MSLTRKRAKTQLNGEKAEVVPKVANLVGAAKACGSVWEKNERENMLIALRKHGHMAMEQLCAAAPGRSEEQVKGFINSLWKDARRAVETNRKPKLVEDKNLLDREYLGPVDKWLGILKNYFKGMEEYKRLPLARTFLYISLYEEHPDPSECQGIDFQAMYEFLYCALCGYPTKDLNEPTAAYALETLGNFGSSMKCRNNVKEVDFLKSVKKVECNFKPGEDNILEKSLNLSKEDIFTEFRNIPGLNPFGVPPELLQKLPENDVVGEAVQVEAVQVKQTKNS